MVKDFTVAGEVADQPQKWSICVQCKEGIVEGQAWEREQPETDGIEHTDTHTHFHTCTHSHIRAHTAVVITQRGGYAHGNKAELLRLEVLL